MSATMQEIQAVPFGTKVTVDGAEWERVADGLQRGEHTLTLDHFTAFVDRGVVSVPPDAVQPSEWKVGCWYYRRQTHTTGHWRYVMSVNGEAAGLLFAVASDDVEQVTWPSSEPLGEWLLVEVTALRTWMKRVAESCRLVGEQPPVVEQVHHDVVPESLTVALHDYARMADDSDFDQILDDHQIGRSRTHVSDVTITGHSYWTPDYSDASDWLGGSFEVTDLDDSITVYWQRTVQIEKEGIGCTCEEVDGDSLYDYLPGEYESWDYGTECG